MCNISKSMRMSRPEYNLCAIKNTNNTENMMKNDLKIAWIYPKKKQEKRREKTSETSGKKTWEKSARKRQTIKKKKKTNEKKEHD